MYRVYNKNDLVDVITDGGAKRKARIIEVDPLDEPQPYLVGLGNKEVAWISVREIYVDPDVDGMVNA